MIDKIQSDIDFYRKLLIPKLVSKGNAGYKSEQIGRHLARFLDRVEAVIYNKPNLVEPAATPEEAKKIFTLKENEI